MADHQKIHPVDVEAAPPPSAPLVPRHMSRSDKGDPALTFPPLPSPIKNNSSRNCNCNCNCCNCCCKFICWTFLTILVLVVAIAATAGILYLVLHPKLPNYSVDRLHITSFTVDLTFTAHATFGLTVTAKNPNKHIGIYYERDSRLSLWYSGSRLCSGTLPVFYQGHRNTTVVTVRLDGKTQLGSGLFAVMRQQQQTGMVPLEFRGDVPVRVKIGGLKLMRVISKVRCGLVVDSLNANNQISIKTSSCKFSLKL